MKLLLPLIVFSIIQTSLFAQITLTPNNNFIVGYEYTSTYHFEQGVAYDPGPSGPNQTWDFSDINGSTTTSITLADISTLPSAASFPNADSGFYDADSQSETFLSNTSEAQSFWGAKTGNGTFVVYNDPQDYLRYPFTYEDTYIDEFSGTSTTSLTLDRMGTATVTCDGYGTLITPAGTFEDVVRVKTVMDYGDFMGNNELAHYYEERFSWYNATERTGLLNIVNANYFGTQFTTVNYFESSTTSNKNLPALQPIALYPNPTSNLLTIEYDSNELNNSQIRIFNNLGQEVSNVDYGTMNTNNKTIDVSSLESGTYQMNLYSNNTLVSRERFIVVHN